MKRPEEKPDYDAERTIAYRERQQAVTSLMQLKEAGEVADDVLWDALVLFQNHPFHTAKNLEFTYTVKGNEIFVDRKEKSITKATVLMAFHKALELGPEVTGPKKLGTFGASYLYPVFVQLGIL